MAQVILLSGESSDKHWNVLATARTSSFRRHGTEHEDTRAFIVVTVGPHTLGISVVADEGQPAESVRPHALALAEIALDRLR